MPHQLVSNQYVHGQRPGLAAIFLVGHMCAASCRALGAIRAPVAAAASTTFVASAVSSTAFVASAVSSSALVDSTAFVASAVASAAIVASAACVSVAAARIDTGGAGAADPRRLAMDRITPSHNDKVTQT